MSSMNSWIAILRGINVSGVKKVPMDELRGLLAEAGLVNLNTYIQSGNLVFNSHYKQGKLKLLIEGAIRNHFGFEVPTQVLSKNDFQSIVNNSPASFKDTSKLYVTFLSSPPKQDLVDSIPDSSNAKEMFQVSPLAVYVYCPDGYGKTKINNAFFEKKLKVIATTRNWKTCQKLLEMVENLDH